MAVPTNPNIPSLPLGQPADADQEAEGAGWLRLLIMSLKTLFVTPPPTDNSTTPATTAYVQTALLNAALPGASLPAQSGNAGKFLQTDGANVSWQPSGVVVRVSVSASQAIGLTNKANLFDCIGTGVVLTFAASATLMSGWFAYFQNNGSAQVTLTPNGAELINGRTTWPLNPGDTLIVQSDGTALNIVFLRVTPQLGSPATAIVANAVASAVIISTCALTTGRSFGLYKGASLFPQVILRDSTGATAATAQIEALSTQANGSPQIIPLTSTTALAFYPVSTPAMKAVVLTDNGTSIGVGVPFVVEAVAATGNMAVAPFSSTKCVAVYSNGSAIRYRVLSIAGSVITGAAAAGSISGNTPDNGVRIASVSSTQGVVVYGNSTIGNNVLNGIVITEASGVVTAADERVISNHGNGALCSGDVIAVNSSRVLVFGGARSATSAGLGLVFTLDVSGTGGAALLLNGKPTPIDAVGAIQQASYRGRLARVGNSSFVLAAVDSNSAQTYLMPLDVRGQSVVPGAGVHASRSNGALDVCVCGSIATIFYEDSNNSSFPTSRSIPLGSVT